MFPQIGRANRIKVKVDQADENRQSQRSVTVYGVIFARCNFRPSTLAQILLCLEFKTLEFPNLKLALNEQIFPFIK